MISNNITISVFIAGPHGIYHFTFLQLGGFYVAPVVGAAIGQLGGHWLHDLVGRVYMRRHEGVIVPEARLIIIWFVTPIYLIAQNIMGASLSQHWPYQALAFGWFLHNMCAIIITTAVYAYLLDAYPEGSGESAAWLNAARTWGGFVVGYVQIIWVQAIGFQKTYGIQSAIVAAIFFLVVFLQFYGSELRHSQGPMNFKTH